MFGFVSNKLIPSPSSSVATCRKTVRINSLNTLDRLVMALVDVMLVWGVTASLSYWLVLIFRWPVWSWYPAVVVILGAVIHLYWHRFTWPTIVVYKRWAVALFIVCLASASINIFTNRPDGDDISFSHRAFVAAVNLTAPIALTDTRYDVENLPPLSPIHLFTSVEVTTALVAHALGVSQLFALHMCLGTLSNFMLPAIYFLLLRFFRIRTQYALLGTLGILIFFALSGNVHRDWGNFTVVRSWQGKSILMEIILPLALLYSLRYQLFGRRSDCVRLHAIMSCGIGLSGSGLFLVPFVIGTSAIATWIATQFSRRSMVRGFQSFGTLIQPIIVSALPWLGLLPKLGDVSAYTQGWPSDYSSNLALVFHAKSLPLYIAYLVTAFLVRKKIELLTFFIYLGIAATLLTAPGISKFLMNIVTPGAYWRFSYALFVPLYAGLALVGLSRLIVHLGKNRALSFSWLAILVIATLAIKTPSLNSEIVSLPGPKFSRSVMGSLSEISGLTKKYSVVLAPESVAGPLGLLRPDIKFIVIRPGETVRAFSDAGRAPEGELRGLVGAALETCDLAKVINIRIENLWPDIGLVIYPMRCGTGSVRSYLSLGSNWQAIPLRDYQALLRTDK